MIGNRDPRARTPRISSPRLQAQGETPAISVVVASNRSRALLDACLASLRPQCQRTNAELIVVRAGEAAEVQALRAAYPWARIIAGLPTASIPELRGLGMLEAHGDIVALTEDHCVADDAWVETLLTHSRDGADVIGGGMGNAQERRAVDWAAYFAEYGFFADSRDDAPEVRRPLLTGANVAYTRRVVGDVARWAAQGEWENVAHNRLFARGSAMRFVRTAAVYQNRNYRVREFCVDRYVHGRDFARKRLAEQPGTRRWLLLGASPLLPFLLTWRVARTAARRRWPAFLRALPATFVFLTAWSIGEAVGYVQGPTILPPQR